jgi:hypothetical protein
MVCPCISNEVKAGFHFKRGLKSTGDRIMKTREGFLILVVTTLFGLDFGTDLMAQEEQPGFRNEQRPASKVPQPNPIFPRLLQPDPGIPGPNTPRLNPGLPQEIPLPRTSRPAEVIEEKMVISPTDISRAQEALRAKGLNPGDDGKLDEETQEALAKFQKQNSLPATGVLDDKTSEKLGIKLHPETN